MMDSTIQSSLGVASSNHTPQFEEHKTLQQIVNHISEGLIFIEKSGTIAFINPAAATLMQLHETKDLQKQYWDLFSDYYFGFSMRTALVQLSDHRRIFLTLENEVDIEVSTSAIPDKGLALIVSDRTEQQKMQRCLNQAERLKELGEMAATLAHEIRNPLGAIEGFAQLLKRELEQASQRNMLEAILEGTEALNTLVTHVLDYARPLYLHFSPHDLLDIIREVIALCNVAYQNLTCSLQSSWTTYPLSLDRARMKLVLLNILHNAFDAGATWVTLNLTSEGVLTIHDNGSGISAKNLEKIFTPFFTTKSQGNGLGLAQSWAVVKAHGGTLQVTSELGKGTTFYLKL